ncbi:efflux RND transporter periplasmic adaptor subunit [Acetobacteraceae bacterium H6797]|nr:efflux RND transporter periplasmic adaptor subunit [Acetobacteraceae bacterium H6797]
MRTATQLLALVVIGGFGLAWQLYADRIGVPRPLALIGLEAQPSVALSQATTGGPLGVSVSPVRKAVVTDRAESVGTVRARDAITVTTKVSGIVTAIRFTEGQRVNEGDVLAELDNAGIRAEYDQARAQLDDMRTQLQRARALQASQNIAVARIDQLEAQTRQAEGRLRQYQARLDEAKITAPFSGRVGLKQVSLGALVQPGTAVTTLDDTSRMRVEFAVPEVFIARLQAGSQVTARSVAYGERRFRGAVAVVDTRLDPATRTIRVISEFDNADEALKPGLFLTIELMLEQRENALLIPEEALDPVGDRVFVYLVKDGRAKRTQVRLGQRLQGEVEVRQGIAADDQVVVRGIQRLRNDAPVRVIETITRPLS